MQDECYEKLMAMEPMSEGIRNGTGISDIRVAYLMSTREFARAEPVQLDDGTDVSAAHRGSLPELLGNLARYNRAQAIWRTAPDITVGLILMDDDVPERDFSDLEIPMHVEPSSAFTSIKMPKGASQDDREAVKMRREDAKAEYEQRLLGTLREHKIDIVVADRYMHLLSYNVFLKEYLGLTLNTRPAMLPDGGGRMPTKDAMERALRTGYCFHGNTFDIVANQIGDGTPLTQEEVTPIYPGKDTLAMLRRRNRENENQNACTGLIGYLRDPRVHSLISLHRKLLHTNGDRDEIYRAMTGVRRKIIQGYRELFDLNQKMQKNEPGPEGTYKYNAFMLKERISQRAEAARREAGPRAPLLRAL